MANKRIRNIVKQFFLSEEENKKLVELMKKNRVRNFSSFARKKLLRDDFKIWFVTFPEYSPVSSELIYIGRSINSIAKTSTQFGNITESDFREVGHLLEQMVEVVNRQQKEDERKLKRR
ncbi:TPA: transposase [Streptococcus suis]|uniref:Tn5252, orf 9 protein n=1 Tax=Streptococcus suis TaxID=1307 RepID=A0A0Z8UPS8_STRSU|nr:hypothetical protein [Streptococcus suis]MDW8749837.1 transposase [Streptococcus suis]NQH24132.1 transposase [Streptococcus suis]NQH64624.1 transposase [Streptococcus suis]NQN39075.1 transposase [Streptococcus suis]NQP21945.1 transposase [Streptococcus suis]